MRVLVVFLIASLVATGCSSSTYKIPGKELRRLATIEPAARGEVVRVQQELSDPDLGPYQPITSETRIELFPWPDFVGPDRRNYHRPRANQTWGAPSKGKGGGGGGGSFRMGGGGGGGGGDGILLVVIIAVVIVVAAIAVLSLAIVEGSRFDGFAKIHPMHPVYLIGNDGSKGVMPLAWIDRETAAWARHGYIRQTEGPWITLGRAPLDRQGPTFAMFGGMGTYRELDGSHNVGPAAEIQLGFFPWHQFGLVGSMFLGWRNTGPSRYLINARYSVEGQLYPLSKGFVQGGLYLGYGGNYIREEVLRPDGGVSAEGRSTSLKTGGVLLQLDVNTRVALTARIGVANTGDGAIGESMFGISVY
jgi:hypothetical protein